MFTHFVRPVRSVAAWLAVPLLSFSAADGADAGIPGLDAKWRHYEAPHFELYSRESEGSSRQMLRSLEGMRAAFVDLLGVEPRPTPRVAVYTFSNVKLLKAYASPAYDNAEKLVGEYRTWPDRDYITLSMMDGHDMAMWIVYSNYAKHLLTAAGGTGRPSWLYQGMSMFFGNLEVRGNSVVLGEADSLRSRLTRENPKVDLAQLFRAEEGRSFFRAQDQANIFHAQAWGVLHYWYLGQTQISWEVVGQFVRFVLLYPTASEEQAVEQKFRECFATDYAEMERRIAAYLRRNTFSTRSVRVSKAIENLPVSVRALDLLEARERLADVLLRNRQDPAAKFVLLEALESARAARAAESLGVDAAIEGDARRAQEFWVRAADAGSDNSQVVYLAAHTEFARWFATTDLFFRLPAEKAEQLRRALARCIELTPAAPEHYEALAWVESAAPRPSVANVNLVQAKFDQLREKSRTLFALAIIRSRLGDHDGALALVDKIESSPVSENERRFAQRLRDHVEKQRALATN